MLFDTHAHYDDERFSSDENPLSVDGLLQSLFAGDVKGIVNAGTNLDTCKKSIELSEKFDMMYAAVGIHPSDCFKYSDMDEVLQKIAEMSKHEKAVAIGEIGLDYHYDFSPKDVQKRWFYAQLELAEQLSLPAVIHDRDAHGDVFDMIRRFRNIRVVMHSCSESAEAVKQLTRMGHYVSFSGSLTFKNAKSVIEAAKAAPLDMIMIETDCPYLSPVPHRGKMNHSGLMRHTAEVLAEIKGVSYDDICQITYENALRFFGIDRKEK